MSDNPGEGYYLLHLFTYAMKVIFLEAAPSLMPFAATYSEKPSKAADSANTNERVGKEEVCTNERNCCMYQLGAPG